MPPKKKAETVSKTRSKATPKPPKNATTRAPRKAVKTSAKISAAKVSPAAKPKKNQALTRPSAVPARPATLSKKLPQRGETQLVAFIRDPQCIFTYWEVTPESIEAVKNQLKGEYKDSSMVLRVFRKGAGGQIELIQEIFVGPNEMNRYIQVDDPQGSYFLEIAQKGPSGQILVYARSNSLTTGPSGFSNSLPAPGFTDPRWETPAGLLEYFAQEEYTENFLTPGGPSSADSLRRKKGRYASSNIG